MREPMIQTKAALLAKMRERPDMWLEFCHGVRGNNWSWLRVPDKGETIMVHGRALNAVTLSKQVVFDRSASVRGTQVYRLAELEPTP